MNNSILDNFKYSSLNNEDRAVGAFLKEKIKAGANLSIVSAYFTIYAYEKMKEQLDEVGHLRFLFGEPTFIKNLDPEKTNKRDFKIEDDNLIIPTSSRVSQKVIAKECAKWIKEKVEIKSMIKPNFLHGKMYIVDNPGKNNDAAIVGSSNFTVNGLGLGGSPNIELNVKIDSHSQFIELNQWFDNLWNNDEGLVEDVKEEVLKYIEQLHTENDPQFIYFKTLFHIFEHLLYEHQEGGLLDSAVGFYDTVIWKMLEKYPFQQDGVRGAINKITKYNGCILADSVGLGKTYQALAVIKYFEIKRQKVLLICPKKLSNNWTLFTQNNNLNPLKDDRLRYDVLYHTDMGRTKGISDTGIHFDNFSWGDYDLVVVDESHNFRGNTMERTTKEGDLKYNRSKWLLEKIIKEGRKTSVLLLSATPVNNNLKDLRNQLYLITEGENSIKLENFHLSHLGDTLKNAQTQFTYWAKSPREERTVSNLLTKLNPDFFKLLDGLTIARSRSHIENYYDISQIGKFPKRAPIKSIYPDIDTENMFPSYDRINKQISEFKLTVYNPSAFVKEDKKSKYNIKTQAELEAAKKEKEEREKNKKLRKNKNKEVEVVPVTPDFNQADREHFLIGMMKVNYLKRLESSVKSFEVSIFRTTQKINSLIEKIEKFKQNQLLIQDTKLDAEPDDADFDNNDDSNDNEVPTNPDFQVGKKLLFDLADIDIESWLTALKTDKDTLSTLYNTAKAIDQNRDAKLKELKKVIEDKIKNPKNKDNKKIIVFTAFSDTASYLFDALQDWARQSLGLHSAMVAGSETKTTLGRNDFNEILTNFSPISKNRIALKSNNQTEQIDILIATDCISEGQNLQDCDFLINYDIHWNPVRVIQRFGRIDRLGSTNDTIHLVNFWPTRDLDNYINLKERVESRMALVDVTATGEDNILNTEEIEDIITEDLKYRNEQLKRLQKEVLDLEDMNDSVSLSDFSLDDFRRELLNFFDKNKKQLRDAPLGLYAVVPAPAGNHKEIWDKKTFKPAENQIITPGVIYCLRLKESLEGAEKINPLQPYFLVYIKENGEIRFNFAQAKQVLEILRLLCQGQTSPFKTLCDLFNQETNDGSNMTTYSALLKKALEAINHTFKRKVNQSLTFDFDAVVPIQSEQQKTNDLDNFELITWLVII